nr:MAG TPA: hypothetical protein [Caudoviricetes sp.]
MTSLMSPTLFSSFWIKILDKSRIHPNLSKRGVQRLTSAA